MENRELLRRQQLLDRFLAGDIDKATYDEMVAEIDRLSGAPTNAPTLADRPTSELLEGEELERLKQAVAQQAAPQPKKPLTEQELKEILVDLEYTTNARRHAADKLATAEPNQRRDEVAKLLEPLLSDSDQFMRSAGAKALGVWGNSESVPALLKLLDDGAHAVRWAAIESLGNLQDEQAAKPLTQCVRANNDRPNASRALQAMGPVDNRS